MPKPLAICLEDLDAHVPGARYLRCVALPGQEAGLTVDGSGRVLWRSDEAAACEIWVSLDDRLILFRREGGTTVVCRRGGRSLEAPAGKPVVLLDQDCIELAGKRLRIHIHGVAPAVTAPSFLPERTTGGGVVRAAATAVAIGAALGGAACKKAEQRTENPDASPVSTEAAVPTTPPLPAADAGTGDIVIEVRTAPPSVQLIEPVPPSVPDAAAADAGEPDAPAAPPQPASSPDAGPATAPEEPRPNVALGHDAEPADAATIEVRVSPPRIAPPDGWTPGGRRVR
jgi:hypothetical protein